MKRLENIKFWRDHHRSEWLSLLRIVLGLTLILKGLVFITNPDVLSTFLKETGITDDIGTSIFITTTAQLIIILHLVGGVCIAFGLHTRLFCLLNLPALIGAVLFVNLNRNMLKPYSELWLSVIVLAGLIWFLIKGNDRFPLESDTDRESQYLQ
jgi:putative oxidoreductase